MHNEKHNEDTEQAFTH